jgi:hypothetical protein
MLYRHRLEFGIGHGVSVRATLAEPGVTRAQALETQFVPQAEVEQQTPPTPADDPNITGIELDMKELALMPKVALLASLRRLQVAYASWIRREARSWKACGRLVDHQSAARDQWNAVNARCSDCGRH